MTKKLDLSCPRCEGGLQMTFPEDDDGSYSVDNTMSISVQCWECNIVGSIDVKVTDIDIVDEEAEEENDPEHEYRCTCLECGFYFHYSRWESEKARPLCDHCDRCESKKVENLEIEFKGGQFINKATGEVLKIQ